MSSEKIGVVGIWTIVGSIVTIIAFLYTCNKSEPNEYNYSKVTINNPSDKNSPSEKVSDYIPPNTTKKPIERRQVQNINNNSQFNQGAENELDNDDDKYINHSTTKKDVVVVIIDNNLKPVNYVSADIINLYQNKGFSGTSSLFSSSFFNSKYLEKLEYADSKVIDKLSLASYTNYIVLGRYVSKFRDGSGEFGKVVCDATLDVKIISCISKEQIDGFKLGVSNGGFDDEMHAEKGAVEKLINQYEQRHIKF